MQITRNSIETAAGPSEWFTGAVYIDTVAAPSNGSRLSASSVHFTPGARTARHTHPNGQSPRLCPQSEEEAPVAHRPKKSWVPLDKPDPHGCQGIAPLGPTVRCQQAPFRPHSSSEQPPLTQDDENLNRPL